MSDTGGPPLGGLSRPLFQAVAADALDCPVDGLPPLAAGDLAELKRILRGEASPAVPIDRARAVRALLRSDPSSETAELLGRVLANEGETTRVRTVAAYGLGRLPSPAAERALVRNLSATDTAVRAEVVTALGRMGSAEALDRIKAMPKPADRRSLRKLSLARLAIALRAGASDEEIDEARRDLRSGTSSVQPKPGAPQRTFDSKPVEAPEMRELVRVFDGSTYGISLRDDVGFSVPCGRATYVLFLNSRLERDRFVDGVRSRGMIAGILGARDSVSDRVIPRYLVLTTPAAGGVEVLITRTDGELAFSGEAKVDGGDLRLALQAAGDRAVPARVDGTLTSSDLRWRLVVSDEARPKGQGREIPA